MTNGFDLPTGLSDPGWRYIAPSPFVLAGPRGEKREQQEPPSRDSTPGFRGVAKAGRGLLDSLGGDATQYGSGLSFSPDQIGGFQEAGLSPQAAAGPEGTGGGFSPGAAGAAAGAGSFVNNYLSRGGDIGESAARGGLTGATTAMGATIGGPIGALAGGVFDVAFGGAMRDPAEPSILLDIGSDPSYKTGVTKHRPADPNWQQKGDGKTKGPMEEYQEPRALARGIGAKGSGDVTYPSYDVLGDPKNKANPEHTRWWGEKLGVPVKENEWVEVHNDERIWREPHSAAYFAEEPPELSQEEYMQMRQKFIEENDPYGVETIKSPSGSQIIHDSLVDRRDLGTNLYQSTEYPFINVYTEHIDNQEFGLGLIDALEKYAGQLSMQGLNPQEVFGEQFRHRYDPSEQLIQEIFNDLPGQRGMQGVNSPNGQNLPSGLLDQIGRQNALPSGLR